jgi:hypothetical protein
MELQDPEARASLQRILEVQLQEKKERAARDAALRSKLRHSKSNRRCSRLPKGI